MQTAEQGAGAIGGSSGGNPGPGHHTTTTTTTRRICPRTESPTRDRTTAQRKQADGEESRRKTSARAGARVHKCWSKAENAELQRNKRAGRVLHVYVSAPPRGRDAE